VVPPSRRRRLAEAELAAAAAAAAAATSAVPEEIEGGGLGPANAGAGAPSCLEAALQGTLAALMEAVHRPEDCAAAMVLAFHRILADGRCDRGCALLTL